MKIRQTHDKEKAKRIMEQLKKNGGYCPCAVIKNEDTKCMCKEFKAQEEGECHCGLYIKSND